MAAGALQVGVGAATTAATCRRVQPFVSCVTDKHCLQLTSMALWGRLLRLGHVSAAAKSMSCTKLEPPQALVAEPPSAAQCALPMATSYPMDACLLFGCTTGKLGAAWMHLGGL